MLVTFGYLTPVFLLPNYVTDIGMDPRTGATLVGIFSAVNAVSRVILGIAADKFGRFNILALCTILSGLSGYIFWLNTHNLAMAVVFVIFYGANGGGFVSLFPVVAAEVIGVEKLSAAVGLLYSGNLFGEILLQLFFIQSLWCGEKVLTSAPLKNVNPFRQLAWNTYRFRYCDSIGRFIHLGDCLCWHNPYPRRHLTSHPPIQD